MILETPASGGGDRRCFHPSVRATLVVSLLGLLLWKPSNAQPLAFETLLVDPAASGDCKDTGDFDGDGDADGVVGGADLRLYVSNGAARTFQEELILRSDDDTQQWTTDIAVADVDADGDLDIVGADEGGTQNVQWIENPRIALAPSVPAADSGVSAWAMHIIGTHGSWAHDIEVGAIDGVAGVDVVTLGNGFFKIHFQDAGGQWTTVDFGQHATDGSPAIADIDGDGDNDIFVQGGWIRNPPTGRRNPANWTFFPITNSDPGDGPATTAVDIDRDGRMDLVTCRQHDDGGALAWYKNPANPTVASWTRTVIAASAGSHHLRVADFDGDSRPDLLVALELSLGYVRVYRNTGSTPAFTMHPVTSGGGGHNAAVGDLDGNGLPDVWAADWIGYPPLRAYFNGPNVIFRDGFETGDTSKWSPGS
jgi:hypothetical protein